MNGCAPSCAAASCMGCFYIESPAMRGLLRKLRCDNYVHLVAASSIIRPGVASSGMMRAYIQRFHQPNAFEYLHPVFKEHLSETFGVMVYQEDVMKILHHFAGLGLDEADVMRRMMTGKKRSSTAFARLQQKYFDNCAARKLSGIAQQRSVATDGKFWGLFVLQGALGEFRGGVVPKPVPENLFPAGIHGGGDQQFWRVLQHGILCA
jgi:DNA polymerase III alpha subunit